MSRSLFERTLGSIGSFAESTMTSMQLCPACSLGTVQSKPTTSGSSGLTMGTTGHGFDGLANRHPVLVSSAPHVAEPAGNVVLQKFAGSSGKPALASAKSVIT